MNENQPDTGRPDHDREEDLVDLGPLQPLPEPHPKPSFEEDPSAPLFDAVREGLDRAHEERRHR